MAAAFATRAAWPSRWEAIALACLVLAGYGNIIGSYFLADDFLLIHTVLDGHGRPDWTVALHHLYQTQYVETFRPLVTLLHTIAYTLWGARPAGYHLLNLGFHLLNGLLLYRLVHRIGGSPSRVLAFFAAAVFVTHPIHPEAVTYIGSLPGLACTTFYLLALQFALGYRATSSRDRLALGVGSFLCALGAKEEAVSLPLSVWLLGLALPAPRARGGRLWASTRTALPFFAVLVVYLGYRWLIFGRIAPVYYSGVHGTPFDILRGIGSFLMRLISPINLSHAGHSGTLIFWGVLAVWVTGLSVIAGIGRPRLARLGFCVGAFAVLLIPLNKVLIFGIADDLTNSRFLYLPSLAFAAFVASVVCGGIIERPTRLPLAVLTCYVGLTLPLLIANNSAWADASRLMRRIQQESRRLTGNMVNVEVVNIPDTVHGVFFDRGGFRRALLYPFVPDNAMHHRERILRIPMSSRDGMTVDSTFPDPSALNGVLDPVSAADPSGSIRVVFQPGEPRVYRGELVIRHPRCPVSSRLVSVRGRGTLAPPFQTGIVATISPGDAFRERADSLTFVVSVADARDGLSAEDVSIRLAPEEPWQLRYFALDSTGRRGRANAPVRIDDGGSKAIVMELTPTADVPRGGVIAPRISALNAPTVPAIKNQTIISTDGVSLPPPRADARMRPDVAPVDRRQPAAESCPELQGLPTELDFGVVPTSAYPLRQDRPFMYYGEPAALLFWDDARQRILPLQAVEQATPLFEAVGGDLSRWQRSPGLGYVRLSTGIAGFHIEAAGEFLAATDLDVQTSQAAFLLLTMRSIGVASPYAMLSWKHDAGEPDSARGIAAVVTVPDGYWHTYAIPLHALPSWRDARRVRYLRLQPALSKGWAEISSIRIIAAPR